VCVFNVVCMCVCVCCDVLTGAQKGCSNPCVQVAKYGQCLPSFSLSLCSITHEAGWPGEGGHCK